MGFNDYSQMGMVEVVVAMEAVATVVEVMEEEEEAMGAAATEGGVEEEDMVEEGAATEDGVEEDMVEGAEEETGGTGETVGGALLGGTTTSTELWEDLFGALCSHQCHITVAAYYPSPVDNITDYIYIKFYAPLLSL